MQSHKKIPYRPFLIFEPTSAPALMSCCAVIMPTIQQWSEAEARKYQFNVAADRQQTEAGPSPSLQLCKAIVGLLGFVQGGSRGAW